MRPARASHQPVLRSAALMVAVAAALLACGPAAAGRTCEERPLTAQRLESGMALAQRTAAALEAEHQRSGTRVVLLARAGQDLTRYGLQWSHMGFAYRTPEGPWHVAHKLNRCGTASADLYRQGLGEFFLDDPWRYEAAWTALDRTLQDTVYAAVTDGERVRAMHVRDYSMVSYAWGTRYQQSNQWVLETLAAAIDRTVASREQAQAALRLRRYEPAALRIGALTRLGGRMTAANIAFDDHPNEKRFADRIETVTADSVFDWLQRTGLGGRLQRT